MILRQILHVFQFLLLALLQILVFNSIQLFGVATPLAYIALLIYFPLNAYRTGNIVWAFCMGLLMDIFTNQPGVAAASMTFLGLVQPVLLQLMAPKEAVEDMIPNFHTMGRWNHVRYILLLCLIYCIVFFAIESFSYYDFHHLLLTMGSSTLFTFIVIILLETFRGEKAERP